MKQSVQRAMIAFVVIVVVLLGLSLYGWYSGAWNEAPTGYGSRNESQIKGASRGGPLDLGDRR